MGRLVVFLLGLLVGAAGVYSLFYNGTLHAPGAAIAVAGAPPGASAAAATGTGTPMPATNGVEPPPMDGAPRIDAQLGADGSAPLSPPTAIAPDASPAEPAAEQPPDAVSAEGAAAVTAAAAAAQQKLLLPVQGVKPAQLVDTYTQSRGEGRLHDAIDIMAARGTPVFAVADGRVAKLFDSKRGGTTLYQFDREEKLAYYYAHLDSYAPGIAEGKQLKRGDPIGFVGSTGNASPDGPHLHFAVFVLGPEKHWWQGTAVNPYPLLGGR